MINRRELLKTAGILTTIPMIVPYIAKSQIINNSMISNVKYIKPKSLK